MKKKVYIISLMFFIIDLITKQLIIKFINLGESIKVIPNFFYLTYVRNNGAAFSIFQNKQILIILVTMITLFFINKYINDEDVKKGEAICYGLITGGILGNLFDRIMYRFVIDFFDFRFGQYHYPVFNTADSFIVIGVIILIIYNFKKEKKNGNKSS